MKFLNQPWPVQVELVKQAAHLKAMLHVLLLWAGQRGQCLRSALTLVLVRQRNRACMPGL
jgi:hypothetical protein